MSETIKENIKDLAKKVVEAVGEMKISEVKDDWDGRILMDFYGVAKRVVEVRPMDLAMCCELEQKMRQ